MNAQSDLVARLGLPADARAIILNADDFGMCHAANRAIIGLLREGRLDSATVMTPCGWAPEALDFAREHPDVDVGVHLVLTSEWRRYRWRPLTGAATSLVDADGWFPATVREVEEQADSGEVAAEIVAQLDAALAAGVDVTHLDNHMGSVYGLETGRHFLEPVLELAAARGLPFRLPRVMDDPALPPPPEKLRQQAIAIVDALGVVIPDRLWTHPFPLAGEGTPEQETYEQVRDGFLALLRAAQPGVTELYLHPMVDDDELRATVDFAAPKRGYELRLLADPVVSRVIHEEGLIRVGWRALRDVQRSARHREDGHS